jgi:outer membrane protein assembly factor BamD
MTKRITDALWNNRHLLAGVLAVFLVGSVCADASGPKIFKKKQKKSDKTDASASAEPDKVLYDRAVADVKRRRFLEARLSFQTLINTYPDSEYLAKAKLGTADSYYNEGGTSNLTQAIAEYKDFETFFPFLDEAAYAQMQVAMAHYHMMEKADRDNSQAQDAEEEFQTFLLKYPQSPLVPKAEQNLRNVQEVLADGEYRTAQFYYIKMDYPASAARLMELAERYPLYSQSDETLWMLGQIYERAKRASRNEDDKNHWSDLAGQCYSRIVRDYPLSKRAGDAKSRLQAMGQPVPAADPGAFARMKNQQMYEKQHHGPMAMLAKPMDILKTGPNVSAAARGGDPNMNPPDAAISAREVLRQGAAGPNFNISARPVDAGDANAPPEESGAPVEAVPSSSADGVPVTDVGAQIIAAPTSSDAAAPSSSPSAPANPPESSPAAPPTDLSGAAPITLSNSGTPAPAGTPGDASAPQPAATTSGGTPATGATSPAPGSASANSKPAATKQKAPKADSKTESSSKKKKGVHKLIPF